MEKEFKCDFCLKVYDNKNRNGKSNLEKHIKYCMFNPNRIKYKCNQCGIEYDKSHSLVGHKRACGKIFDKKKKTINTVCKFCGFEESNYNKLGQHVSRCKLNPNYAINDINFRKGGLGRVVSDSTKKKISESRIKYLKDNPDKVPYLLNHSSSESYPEKYFSELFEKENLNIKRYLQIGLYELDFYILDKKIDIEIDGEQHYTDKKIVESDIRRTKFLTDNGWKIFRIRWADYQRLHYTEKEKYIKEILNKIASYP